MKNKKSNLDKYGCITVFITFIVGSVLYPVLTFLFAYLGGLLLNWILGAKLVNGLNLMFDTTRFTRELIPLTCDTLATIGRYFRSTQTNRINNK